MFHELTRRTSTNHLMHFPKIVKTITARIRTRRCQLRPTSQAHKARTHICSGQNRGPALDIYRQFKTVRFAQGGTSLCTFHFNPYYSMLQRRNRSYRPLTSRQTRPRFCGRQCASPSRRSRNTGGSTRPTSVRQVTSNEKIFPSLKAHLPIHCPIVGRQSAL